MAGERTTVMLWVLGAAVVAGAAARVGPVAWQHLFPPPTAADVAPATGELPGPERVVEVVHRTLATLGTPPEGGGPMLLLPRGASPRALQDALRGEEPLADCEVYVTQVDDLLWRLRVFGGGESILERAVRPWLPDRPVVGGDPPELAFLVLFPERSDEQLRTVGRWKSPLAIGISPFAPHAIASARQAAWDSKAVAVVLDPATDLVEQLDAAPDATVALLVSELAAGTDEVAWVRPMAGRGVTLVDGRQAPPAKLRAAAQETRVPYLRRAGHLAGDAAEAEVLALNRAVVRGYGVVTVAGTADGVARLERFIEAAKQDGYPIVFPAELARMIDAKGG